MDVAVGRRVPPQSAAGRGKKRDPTRPIARSPGPSAMSSPTAAARRRHFVPHIRRRGEERRRCRRGERARRWVVERTHSWFNRFRKLLIRWEKRPQNYLALVQFAAMLIVWRLVG